MGNAQSAMILCNRVGIFFKIYTILIFFIAHCSLLIAHCPLPIADFSQHLLNPILHRIIIRKSLCYQVKF